METVKNIHNIPAEKFTFTKKSDLKHDSKFDTKPVTYFQGAMKRFCKNKGAVVGAIVIVILFLFAIIGPIVSPYTVKYYDTMFKSAYPRNELCVKWGWDFWDGCKEKTNESYLNYFRDYALGEEIGKPVIKNGKVSVSKDGKAYSYRYDTYYGVGFGKQYNLIKVSEFEDIQRYQDETGRQVLYPTVKLSDRVTRAGQDKKTADPNIYYKAKVEKDQIIPILDENGNIQVNYWMYKVDGRKPGTAADYTSKMRMEGEEGVEIDGVRYYYAYGTKQQGNTVEVRMDYYEYYCYYHTQVAKDGISEPSFLFGTTSDNAGIGGKDIFTCLSSGAWFSFMFAITVAVVNLVVGVIWGSIAGYNGGKIDLAMERFTDVLGAVPTIIIITLLKYHMGSASQAIVLFIAFFATGWIGMAGTTRMQFYRFKNQEYVLAARTLGARDGRIMFKHIFPNAIGTLVTSCALVIPGMIYSETNFSYLGIINLEGGNITSVGTMLAAGQADLLNASYVAVFPCVFLVLLMLSFNLFGNGLRDAFNPSLRGVEE